MHPDTDKHLKRMAFTLSEAAPGVYKAKEVAPHYDGTSCWSHAARTMHHYSDPSNKMWFFGTSRKAHHVLVTDRHNTVLGDHFPGEKNGVFDPDKGYWIPRGNSGEGTWFDILDVVTVSYIKQHYFNPVEGASVNIKVLSAVLPATSYDWFVYTGTKIVTVQANRAVLTIAKGTKFGTRPSSNGKLMRVVTEDGGITRVGTLPTLVFDKLMTNATPFKATKVRKGKVTQVDTSNIDKMLRAFWTLYRKYRDKYPSSTLESHIKVFQWAKDFSQTKMPATVTLYRGSSLRDFTFKPNKTFTLKHARGLISFTNKQAAAIEFSEKWQPKAVSYLLSSKVSSDNILLSPTILINIGKQLAKLGDDYAEDSESFIDEGTDLAKHESEYFVVCPDTGMKVTAIKEIRKR